MSDPKRWAVLGLLRQEVVDNIIFAVVFGKTGGEAVYMCRNHSIFGIGSNENSCLGYKTNYDGVGIVNGVCSLTPHRIQSLCEKHVSHISFGAGPHLLALTKTGEVYAWGYNKNNEIGGGNAPLCIIPVVVSGALSGVKVNKVACGSHHSLAVCDQGSLYGWGHNSFGQIGIGSTSTQSSPKRIQGSEIVIEISCGQVSSLALNDSGELFTWGSNSNGQLGIGSTTNQLVPCPVSDLKSERIVQIACGYAHVLAINDEGKLFAWGSNSCGQLAIKSRSNQLVPIRAAEKLKRIKEAAAIHLCNISVVQTQDDCVYMWGQCRSQIVAEPIEVPFKCTNDVFSCFANPPVSWKPIEFESSQNCLHESMIAAFDDSTSSDVEFLVENKSIYVHKAILKIRCDHFRRMFHNGIWHEAEKEVIDISQFSYPVYRAFLMYLYTDRVEITVEDAVGLLDLAISYCEYELKAQCLHIIRNGITVDNAALIYAAAVRFEEKDIESFCFLFCLKHMTAVTQSDAFEKLDETLLKRFVADAAKQGAFKN